MFEFAISNPLFLLMCVLILSVVAPTLWFLITFFSWLGNPPETASPIPQIPPKLLSAEQQQSIAICQFCHLTLSNKTTDNFCMICGRSLKSSATEATKRIAFTDETRQLL